jgi:hypothetical protein
MTNGFGQSEAGTTTQESGSGILFTGGTAWTALRFTAELFASVAQYVVALRQRPVRNPGGFPSRWAVVQLSALSCVRLARISEGVAP